MKFVFTKHAVKDKLPLLKRFDWIITRSRIKEVAKNPRWSGITKKGQKTAMDLIDEAHIEKSNKNSSLAPLRLWGF